MRRRLATWCAGAAILATAACNNEALTRRELVVYFAPTATQAQHAAARAACAHAGPRSSPEPIPTSTRYPSDRVGDVRFRVDHASDRDINILLQCLRKQPGVVGFQLPESGG